MRFLVRGLCAAAAAVALGLSAAATASVIVNGTRVVFPAADGRTTVRVLNEGNRPALVQVWIDNGNPHATPEHVSTPFLITPPLFRLDPQESQSLRIIHAGMPDQSTLPRDRESLFWLNVLEVPPRPTGPAAKGNYLQFSIRTRLKLFYRPADLAGSRAEAPGRLVWHAARDERGTWLKVHNPTPYYITFIDISLTIDGRAYDASTGMVAPYDSRMLAVEELSRPIPAGAVVEFTTINDYGAAVPHRGAIE